MTLAASALALWLAAAQVAGAAPALDRSEVTLDHAVAVLETDGEQAPRFVLRSDFVLALRTELRMRNAPDALLTASLQAYPGPIIQLGSQSTSAGR